MDVRNHRDLDNSRRQNYIPPQKFVIESNPISLLDAVQQTLLPNSVTPSQRLSLRNPGYSFETFQTKNQNIISEIAISQPFFENLSSRRRRDNDLSNQLLSFINQISPNLTTQTQLDGYVFVIEYADMNSNASEQYLTQLVNTLTIKGFQRLTEDVHDHQYRCSSSSESLSDVLSDSCWNASECFKEDLLEIYYNCFDQNPGVSGRRRKTDRRQSFDKRNLFKKIVFYLYVGLDNRSRSNRDPSRQRNLQRREPFGASVNLSGQPSRSAYNSASKLISQDLNGLLSAQTPSQIRQEGLMSKDGYWVRFQSVYFVFQNHLGLPEYEQNPFVHMYLTGNRFENHFRAIPISFDSKWSSFSFSLRLFQNSIRLYGIEGVLLNFQLSTELRNKHGIFCRTQSGLFSVSLFDLIKTGSASGIFTIGPKDDYILKGKLHIFVDPKKNPNLMYSYPKTPLPPAGSIYLISPLHPDYGHQQIMDYLLSPKSEKEYISSSLLKIDKRDVLSVFNGISKAYIRTDYNYATGFEASFPFSRTIHTFVYAIPREDKYFPSEFPSAFYTRMTNAPLSTTAFWQSSVNIAIQRMKDHYYNDESIWKLLPNNWRQFSFLNALLNPRSRRSSIIPNASSPLSGSNPSTIDDSNQQSEAPSSFNSQTTAPQSAFLEEDQVNEKELVKEDQFNSGDPTLFESVSAKMQASRSYDASFAMLDSERFSFYQRAIQDVNQFKLLLFIAAEIFAITLTIFPNSCRYITDKTQATDRSKIPRGMNANMVQYEQNKRRKQKNDFARSSYPSVYPNSTSRVYASVEKLFDYFGDCQLGDSADCEDMSKASQEIYFSLDKIYRKLLTDPQQIFDQYDSFDLIELLHFVRSHYIGCAALCGVSAAEINMDDLKKMGQMNAHETFILMPVWFFHDALQSSIDIPITETSNYWRNSHFSLIDYIQRAYPLEESKQFPLLISEGTGMLWPSSSPPKTIFDSETNKFRDNLSETFEQISNTIVSQFLPRGYPLSSFFKTIYTYTDESGFFKSVNTLLTAQFTYERFNPRLFALEDSALMDYFSKQNPSIDNPPQQSTFMETVKFLIGYRSNNEFTYSISFKDFVEMNLSKVVILPCQPLEKNSVSVCDFLSDNLLPIKSFYHPFDSWIAKSTTDDENNITSPPLASPAGNKQPILGESSLDRSSSTQNGSDSEIEIHRKNVYTLISKLFTDLKFSQSNVFQTYPFAPQGVTNSNATFSYDYLSNLRRFPGPMNYLGPIPFNSAPNAAQQPPPSPPSPSNASLTKRVGMKVTLVEFQTQPHTTNNQKNIQALYQKLAKSTKSSSRLSNITNGETATIFRSDINESEYPSSISFATYGDKFPYEPKDFKLANVFTFTKLIDILDVNQHSIELIKNFSLYLLRKYKHVHLKLTEEYACPNWDHSSNLGLFRFTFYVSLSHDDMQ